MRFEYASVAFVIGRVNNVDIRVGHKFSQAQVDGSIFRALVDGTEFAALTPIRSPTGAIGIPRGIQPRVHSLGWSVAPEIARQGDSNN